MSDAPPTTGQHQYDPTQLLHEVYRALLDKGLPVERDGDFNAAVQGAEQILRWLGLEPAMPADLASYRNLDLDGQLSYNRRIQGD